MLSRLLRQVLFTLLHFLVSVLVAVQNVYNRVLACKNKLLREELTKREIKTIIERMPKIYKQLKHVVMLVDMDHHSLSDIARLVIWNLVAGVPYVSFFDTTGNVITLYTLYYCKYFEHSIFESKTCCMMKYFCKFIFALIYFNLL